MKKRFLRSKIEEAEQQLTIAEEELAGTIRDQRAVPRAQKTIPSRVVEDALDKLRVSRAKLTELKTLLEGEPEEEA